MVKKFQLSRIFLAALTPLTLPLFGAQHSLYSMFERDTDIVTEAPVVNINSLQPELSIISSVDHIDRPSISNLPRPAAPRTNPTNPRCNTFIRLDNNPRDICIFTSHDTAVDSGHQVAQFIDARGRTRAYGSGSTFLYAHNWTHIFGPLQHTRTFTITHYGVTTRYEIIRRDIHCFHDCDGRILNFGWMTEVLNPNRFGATISLMTCHGPVVSPNDTKYRFIAYARPIR